jgi:hypothetical protein
MSGPAFTAVFTTQNLLGTADVAKVTYELQNLQNQVPTVWGSAIITEPDGSVICTDGTGSFTVYGNDVITPPDTFYMVRFYSGQGELVATLSYLFTGTGTFDLSAYAPITPPLAPKPGPTTGLITSLAINTVLPLSGSITNPNGPNAVINISSSSDAGFYGPTGYTGYTGYTGPNSGYTGYTGYTGPLGPTGAFNPTLPTVVQYKSIKLSSSTSGSVTLDSLPTPGNTLIFIAEGKVTTLTPPAGLTSLTSVTGGDIVGQAWYRTIQSGDSATWTVSYTGIDLLYWTVVEIDGTPLLSGQSGNPTIDNTAGTLTSSASVGSIYPAVIFAAFCTHRSAGPGFDFTGMTPAFYGTSIGAIAGGLDGEQCIINYGISLSPPTGTIVANFNPLDSATGTPVWLAVVAEYPGSGGLTGPTGYTGPAGVAGGGSERLLLGYYVHGSALDATTIPTKYISPVDGHVYDQSDVLWYEAILVSNRTPASGFVNGQTTNPGQSGSNPAPGDVQNFLCAVNGTVLEIQSNFRNESSGRAYETNAGYAQVMVQVKRS